MFAAILPSWSHLFPRADTAILPRGSALWLTYSSLDRVNPLPERCKRWSIGQRALLALQETHASLAEARKTLAILKAGFGFSMDDWARLQREKAALERFVRLRFGDVDVADRVVPDDVATPASQ